MEYYSLKVSKILKGAEEIASDLSHFSVGTEHLVLSILKNDEELSMNLENYNLNYDDFLTELLSLVNTKSTKSPHYLYTPLLKKVIKSAFSMARREEMSARHLLMAIIEEGEGIAFRIMIDMNIDLDKLYKDLKKKLKKKTKELEIYNLGKNLNEVNTKDILVGREKEINLIMETLIRRGKNNPLLIGDAGVGKTAIVEELARRINKGDVPDELRGKKIISLEMSSLVAGTKYRGEFEEKLGNIIRELEQNPDIILFIDEIHTMANAGGAEGAINASDILKPYLARGIIKVIGATTTHEYNKYLAKDKALARRFELIKVVEPNLDETIHILSKLKPLFESHYNIKISLANIREIVNLCNTYITDKCNPDKAIDLLDSVCASIKVDSMKDNTLAKLNTKQNDIIKEKMAMVKLNNFSKATDLCNEEIYIDNKIEGLKRKKQHISSKTIKEVLYRKCNIPLINDKVFNNLNTYLKNNIIGQDNKIDTICNTLTNNSSTPISFLLTGSSGVGKTLTVKMLAEFLNIPLIRIDGEEYSSSASVSKLIGISQGYVGYEDESIFDKLKVNPYSIILFDEIDKASKEVLNLFLTILDEGYITNSRGEKINFKSTYIFLTSNTKLNTNIGFFKEDKTNDSNYEDYFLSRITEVIEYNNINKDILKMYLDKKNIKGINLDNYNYHTLGLRGLDNYVSKQLTSIT